ncbi:hypothetical protein K8I61_08835 [bacterium]|nr:hypothetical protein [bacterium]
MTRRRRAGMPWERKHLTCFVLFAALLFPAAACGQEADPGDPPATAETFDDSPDETMFVLAAGVGAVWDDAHDAGWLFRINGSIRPVSLPFLLAGFEAQYFGRAEEKTFERTRKTSEGEIMAREWSADAGLLTGFAVHVPIELAPPAKANDPRPAMDIAPHLSGGLAFDATTTRRTERERTAETDRTSIDPPDRGNDLAGAYGQLGVRFRFTALEVALAGQAIADRPVQVAGWAGFDVPW